MKITYPNLSTYGGGTTLGIDRAIANLFAVDCGSRQDVKEKFGPPDDEQFCDAESEQFGHDESWWVLVYGTHRGFDMSQSGVIFWGYGDDTGIDIVPENIRSHFQDRVDFLTT